MTLLENAKLLAEQAKQIDQEGLRHVSSKGLI